MQDFRIVVIMVETINKITTTDKISINVIASIMMNKKVETWEVEIVEIIVCSSGMTVKMKIISKINDDDFKSCKMRTSIL